MSKAMPVVKNFGDLHTTEDGQLIVKQRGNDDSMDTCRAAIDDEDADSVSCSLHFSLLCPYHFGQCLMCNSGLFLTSNCLCWGGQDMETIRILQEQYEKESKKANIPVPPIVTIDDYDRFVAKDFTRPVQYQKHKSTLLPILTSSLRQLYIIYHEYVMSWACIHEDDHESYNIMI